MGALVTVKTSRGDGDMVGLFRGLAKVSQPVVSDLLFAGQRQRSRMLEKTAQGVDADGQSFHEYSTRWPVYFYPSKNGKSNKQRASAVARLANKAGAKGLRQGKERSIGTARGKVTVKRTRLGLKFANYAELKAFFGRTVVDLFGMGSGPHMLQALIVRVNGLTVAGSDSIGDRRGANAGVSSLLGGNRKASNNAPASSFEIGIYGGKEGERASAHNEGTGRLPQRRFCGASGSDIGLVLQDITDSVMQRVRAFLGESQ